MIKNVSAVHIERDYFGSKATFESEMTYLYEDRVVKAVDKFFRRAKEYRDDVLKIATDDRVYVIVYEDDAVKWFYFYGPQANRSAAEPVSAGAVKKMVRAEFART